MVPLKGVSNNSDEPEISGALVRFRSKLLAHREDTNARLEQMETSLRTAMATLLEDFQASLMEGLNSLVAGRNSTRRAPETAPPDGAVRFGSVTSPVLAHKDASSIHARSEGPPLLQLNSGGNSSAHSYSKSNPGVHLPCVGLDSMNMCIDASLGVRNEVMGVKKDEMQAGDVDVGSSVDFVQGRFAGGDYGGVQPLFGQMVAECHALKVFDEMPKSKGLCSVEKSVTRIRDKGGGLAQQPKSSETYFAQEDKNANRSVEKNDQIDDGHAMLKVELSTLFIERDDVLAHKKTGVVDGIGIGESHVVNGQILADKVEVQKQLETEAVNCHDFYKSGDESFIIHDHEESISERIDTKHLGNTPVGNRLCEKGEVLAAFDEVQKQLGTPFLSGPIPDQSEDDLSGVHSYQKSISEPDWDDTTAGIGSSCKAYGCDNVPSERSFSIVADKLSVGGNGMNACVGNKGHVIESTEGFVVEVKLNGRPQDGREFNESASVTSRANTIIHPPRALIHSSNGKEPVRNATAPLFGFIVSAHLSIVRCSSTGIPNVGILLQDGGGAHKLEGVSVKRDSLGLSSIKDRREYSTVESGKGILENDNKYVQNLSAPKLSISYSGLADTSNHRYLGLSLVTQGPPVVLQPVPTATSPIGTFHMMEQMSMCGGGAAPFSQYGSPSMFCMPPNGVTGGKSQLSTVQLVAGSLSKRLEKYIEGLRKISHYALQPCFSGFDKRVRDKGSGQPALTYGNFVLKKELTGNMRLLWCVGYMCTLEAPNTMQKLGSKFTHQNVLQLLTSYMSVSVVEETSTSLGLQQHEYQTYLVDGITIVIFHLSLNEAAEVYKKSKVRRLYLKSTDVRRLVFLVCTAGMNLSDEADWGAYHSDIQDTGLWVAIVGSFTGDEDVTCSTTLEQTKVIFAMLLMSSAMPYRPLSSATAQMVDGNRLSVREDFELISDTYHILEDHEEHVNVSQFSQLLLDEENFSEHIIVYMQTAPSALHCFKLPIVNVTVLTTLPSFNPAWDRQVAHLGQSLPPSGYHGVNFVRELCVFQSYFLLDITGSKRSVIVLVHLRNQDILTRPLFGVNSLQGPLVEVVHPSIMNALYASALVILVILPVNLILPYVTIHNDYGDRYVSTPNSPKAHGDYSILVWSFNVAKREVCWKAVLSCYFHNKVHMGVSTAVEAEISDDGRTVILVHDNGLMIMKADIADGVIRKSWMLKPKHVSITQLQKKAELLAILKQNYEKKPPGRKQRIYSRDLQNLKLEDKLLV